MQAVAKSRYRSFDEFYVYYLSCHSTPWNRRLHFFGILGSLACLTLFLATVEFWLLAAVPLVGYGLSWIGHFALEGNRPATFDNPIYSLFADAVMFKDILTAKIKW